MIQEQIQEIVAKVLVAQLGLESMSERDWVSPLRELELDSFSRLELVLELEKQTGIFVPLHKMNQREITARDLVGLYFNQANQYP